MKKLLTWLTAISLTGSGAITVVACKNTTNNNRFNIPVLEEKLRNQIIMKLISDNEFSIDKGKSFNDIINKDKVLEQMLQDIISKLANQHFQNTINSNLLLDKKNEEFYSDEITNISGDIAQNIFYTQYTENIIKKTATSKDEEIAGQLYSLNPQDLMADDSKQGEAHLDQNKYFIYFKSNNNSNDINWKRWQFLGENDDDSLDQLPTIDDLQNGTFIIVKANDKTKDTIATDLNHIFFKDEKGIPTEKGQGDFQIYSIDKENALVMNGKKALEYRFQEYFKNEIKNNDDEAKNFYKPMFTMSYLRSKLFNINNNENSPTKKDIFLNISSDLAKNIQTWNKSDGYKSKIKLVWSFTVKDQRDAIKIRDAIINKIIGNDGIILNNSKQSLKSVYRLLETIIGNKNDSNLGADPFFNLNGYNGMVKVDGDTVSSIEGTGVLSVKDEAKKMIAKANGPAILSKDYKGTGFESNKKGEFDLIFVMPIYLIDILNDKTSEFDYGQSTTVFVKKEDLTSEGEILKLYKSYGQFMDDSEIDLIKKEKLEDIKTQKDNAQNLYIYVEGAPYSLIEFNRIFGTNLTVKTIWTDLKIETNDGKKIEGIQFSTKNSREGVYGNIGIKNKVSLGAIKKPEKTIEGINFEEENGSLYVTVENENLVGTVQDFGSFKLSIDNGKKDGTITTTGNLVANSELAGRTYSYKVNMGQNSADANGYIKSNDFDFYDEGISSLDISNLSSDKKNSLLNQLQFITAKDNSVYESAANNIYPLFLREENILFNPLYENLKKYISKENEKGTSD